MNSALRRKSNTESTLDGFHALAHKRDGRESQEHEGEQDGGICKGGKSLALCYKVIIDFRQRDFAGPLSRSDARKIRVGIC